MAKYFEVRLTCERMQEDGSTRKVTERYITDALTVTEAEARVIEEIAPYIDREFAVISATATKYEEVIRTGDDDRWYKCSYNLITLDEHTAREKRQAFHILISEQTLEAALVEFKAYLSKCMADIEITGVTETKILDFIYYDGKENQ